MTRQNKPRLIDPALDGQGHELRQFGVPSSGELHRATQRLQRGGTAQPRKAPAVTGGLRDGTALQALLAVLAGQGIIADQSVPGDLILPAAVAQLTYDLPDVKFNRAFTNSVIAFGTSITTLVSVSVGPLTSGVSYLLICLVFARLSVDSTGFAQLYARTQSSGSSVAGLKTGTVDGERGCLAITSETVIGAGSSVTMSARGKMDTSTGYASATMVWGLALPLALTEG